MASKLNRLNNPRLSRSMLSHRKLRYFCQDGWLPDQKILLLHKISAATGKRRRNAKYLVESWHHGSHELWIVHKKLNGNNWLEYYFQVPIEWGAFFVAALILQFKLNSSAIGLWPADILFTSQKEFDFLKYLPPQSWNDTCIWHFVLLWKFRQSVKWLLTEIVSVGFGQQRPQIKQRTSWHS